MPWSSSCRNAESWRSPCKAAVVLSMLMVVTSLPRNLGRKKRGQDLGFRGDKRGQDLGEARDNSNAWCGSVRFRNPKNAGPGKELEVSLCGSQALGKLQRLQHFQRDRLLQNPGKRAAVRTGDSPILGRAAHPVRERRAVQEDEFELGHDAAVVKLHLKSGEELGKLGARMC